VAPYACRDSVVSIRNSIDDRSVPTRPDVIQGADRGKRLPSGAVEFKRMIHQITKRCEQHAIFLSPIGQIADSGSSHEDCFHTAGRLALRQTCLSYYLSS
jgi:hypothetical protein